MLADGNRGAGVNGGVRPGDRRSAAGGSYPHGGVILDKAGNLYGTTTDGGNNSGTVFKISKSGKQTILYKFPTSWQVGHPYAGLIQDEAGNLYGTASGQNPDVDCCGTVFKLTR
jgi:uncharacterized repeat protein (TIGR03803 family)